MKTHYISPDILTFETIEAILTQKYKLALSEESKKRINDCKLFGQQNCDIRQTLIRYHDRIRLSLQNKYLDRRLKPTASQPGHVPCMQHRNSHS